MTPPYTSSPSDAVMIAQSSLGLTMTALVWRRPLRPLGATLAFVAAVWLAVAIPIEPDVMTALGFTLGPDHVLKALELSTIIVCAAMVVATPRWIAAFAVAFAVGLRYAGKKVADGNANLAALHLLAFGVLLGLHYAVAPAVVRHPATKPKRSFARQDLAIFAAATAVASVVSLFVLHDFCNSGDEWADTYQAQLFAHFKAYATPPSCPSLYQNYWVFLHEGRMFAQYTPGWPLVMAPFQRLGIVWLAAPLMLGATAVACARLSRRACLGVGEGPGIEQRAIASAGWIGALLSMLGASMLLCAGSRYPHVMVCACFAWAVESAAVMSPKRGEPALRKRSQWLWGAALGAPTCLMIASRPSDGATLGVGIFFYFLYALFRGRIGWRALFGTALSFGAIAGLNLVILRLQLGAWFKTGYSITPWAFGQLVVSMPKPTDWNVALPLFYGSYCWWPCAPALGAGGLVVALRGRGRGTALMLGCGAAVLSAFYASIEFGRAYNPGYGPRFQLPLVVAMAVGGAVLLAPLWAHARARAASAPAFRVAGPAALASLAAIVGILRIAPLVYPVAQVEVHKRSAPMRAIEREQIHHAVVTVGWNGDTFFDPLDLTQNLPLVPDADVLILLPRHGPEEDACWNGELRDRYVYRSVGNDEAELIPVE